MAQDPFERLKGDVFGTRAIAELIAADGLGNPAHGIIEKMEQDRRRFDALLGVRPDYFAEAARGHAAFTKLLQKRPTIFEDIARSQEQFNSFVATGGLAAAQERLTTIETALARTRSFAAGLAGQQAFERLVGARTAIPDHVIDALAGTGALSSLVERLSSPASEVGRRFTEQMEGLSRLVTEVTGTLPSRADLAARFPQVVPALRLPTAGEIAGVDLAAASGLVGVGRDWAAATAAEIAAIGTPWVRGDRPELSIGGYAAFKGMSELVARTAPAAARTTQLVRAELGDYCGEDAEVEPVDDPMLASGLRLAHGFDIRLASLPLALAGAIFAPFGMVASAPDADPDQLDDMIAHILRQLERKLRAFIDARMTAAIGPRWIKQRVNKVVRDKWLAAQEADRAAGRPVGALIDYADFGEYRSIIEQGDNWRDAFQVVFVVKTAVGETLARLGAIRNPSAHVRTMSTEDLLTLRVEGRRLYVWMGEVVP